MQVTNALVLTEHRWLRFASFSAMYFAQGVPLGLLTIALPAWLAEQGASLGQVGTYVGWVSLPWALKLIGGPFMDRFTFLPMGFRRPWVLAMQGGLVVSLLLLGVVGAGFDDGLASGSLALLTAAGALVNTFAAVQDVAVDGMAIDVLPVDERGRANAFMGFGQRAASSSFGAMSGTLLTLAGIAAGALACALMVGLIFALVAVLRERPGERLLPWSHGEATPRTDGGTSLVANTSALIRVLLLPTSLLLIAVEFIARLRDGMALGLFPVLATQQFGLTTESWSWLNGVVGFAAAAFVVFLGPLIDRFGAKRFLGCSLIGSSLAHFVMGWFPGAWDQTTVLVLFCVSEVLTQMVFVAVIALFMNVCWSRISATQFAVYMALANLSRSAGAWALGGMEGFVDLAENFLIMGVLLVVSAGVLVLFKQAKHDERLARLTEQNATPPASGGNRRLVERSRLGFDD